MSSYVHRLVPLTKCPACGKDIMASAYFDAEAKEEDLVNGFNPDSYKLELRALKVGHDCLPKVTRTEPRGNARRA